jgi:hypothetical protein
VQQKFAVAGMQSGTALEADFHFELTRISDVALAKACRKRQVPLPGRGYWAKKAANKLVEARPPIAVGVRNVSKLRKSRMKILLNTTECCQLAAEYRGSCRLEGDY